MHTAEGYALGAVDYIFTPVVPEILRTKVRVFVDLYRMTQQVKRQAEERVALAEERSARGGRGGEPAAGVPGRGRGRAGRLARPGGDRRATRSGWRCSYLADAAALVDLPGRRPRAARCSAAGAEAGDGRCIEASPARAAATGDAGGSSTGPPAGDTHAGGVRRRRARACPLHVPRRRPRRVPVALARADAAGRSPRPTSPSPQTLASRAAIALENARLYHELQQADRQKNEFLSMLAHELRNPLAPIRNAVEVLRHDGTDQPACGGHGRHRPAAHPPRPPGGRPARRLPHSRWARSGSRPTPSNWPTVIAQAVEAVPAADRQVPPHTWR